MHPIRFYEVCLFFLKGKSLAYFTLVLAAYIWLFCCRNLYDNRTLLALNSTLPSWSGAASNEAQLGRAAQEEDPEVESKL
jgi:hypothetical protein